MHIITSSFFTNLPPDTTRISIARWAPKGHRHLPTIRELAPGEWFRSGDVEEYRTRYVAQLVALDPRDIVRRIEDLARGGPAALLCWERPREAAFCHRGYVSAWLHDKVGLQVPEYGLEHEGSGYCHPKLPLEHRIPRAPSLPL